MSKPLGRCHDCDLPLNHDGGCIVRVAEIREGAASGEPRSVSDAAVGDEAAAAANPAETLSLRELLRDAADELEAAYRNQYGFYHADGIHPAQQYKFDRDMELVVQLRGASGALPRESATDAQYAATMERAGIPMPAASSGEWAEGVKELRLALLQYQEPKRTRLLLALADLERRALGSGQAEANRPLSSPSAESHGITGNHTETPGDVTRVELIDHRSPALRGDTSAGRVFVGYGVTVALQYQDDGRTLKVFVRDRSPSAEGGRDG